MEPKIIQSQAHSIEAKLEGSWRILERRMEAGDVSVGDHWPIKRNSV